MLTSPFSLAFVQRPILLEKPLWGVWIVECVLRSVNLCCDMNVLIDHRSQRRWKRSHKETLKSSKKKRLHVQDTSYKYLMKYFFYLYSSAKLQI